MWVCSTYETSELHELLEFRELHELLEHVLEEFSTVHDSLPVPWFSIMEGKLQSLMLVETGRGEKAKDGFDLSTWAAFDVRARNPPEASSYSRHYKAKNLTSELELCAQSIVEPQTNFAKNRQIQHLQTQKHLRAPDITVPKKGTNCIFSSAPLEHFSEHCFKLNSKLVPQDHLRKK